MKNKYIFFIITLVLILFVILISVTSEKKQSNDSLNVLNRNYKIEDIVLDDDKINIYFFWGNGCPHCEEEFKVLERIKEKYNEYCNIYCYEVWYNNKNVDFMVKLANQLDIKVSGVPFTIIGSKTFTGFVGSMEEEIESILSGDSFDNYDVYQEIISK